MERAAFANYVRDVNGDGVRRVRRRIGQRRAAAVVVRDVIQQNAWIVITPVAFVYRAKFSSVVRERSEDNRRATDEHGNEKLATGDGDLLDSEILNGAPV